MNHPSFFTQMMSNTEYFQQLFKNTPSAVAGLGTWAAPTLDPHEIDKRIQELKIVQFWLEQNARLLNTTIQTLEVQKLTLSTLHSMNMAMNPSHANPDATEPEIKAKEATPQADAAPLEWWNALTQQFSQIAAQAMQDSISNLQPTAKPEPQFNANSGSSSDARKKTAPSAESRVKKKSSPPSSH